MYKIHNEEGSVQRLSDMAVIPPAESNRDYRKYLAWVAEGNTAEPMDIVDPWIMKRVERNLILASCDWTQAIDAPLSADQVSAWATYRQALRDLPETYPDGDVVWPDAPA